MNGYLKGQPLVSVSVSSRKMATRIVQLHHAATTFLTIDQEDDDFDGDLKGYVCIGPGVWDHDTGRPAAVHDHGSCLSFVDGHAEYIKWPTPRIPQNEAKTLIKYRGD
jgi:hypothetical protein